MLYSYREFLFFSSMDHRTRWQSRTTIILSLFIVTLLGGLVTPVYPVQAGRSDVVCADYCYIPPKRKPSPEVIRKQENIRYAKQALHVAFAQEEKQYPGLERLLDDQNGKPYQRALTTMGELRAKKQQANANDLIQTIQSQKDLFLAQTGIQAWMSAYKAPIIKRFAPTEGIVGDVVTIHGENLKDTTEVRFLSAKALPRIISDSEIQVTVPQYIGGITFPLEVITRYGTTKSALQFTQTTGDCNDKRITRAMWELLEVRPRGAGSTGECNPQLYNSGRYQSYENLLTYMQQKYGYKKRQPPRITFVFPSYGAAGTKVEIRGNNLYQLKTVLFGNTSAQFTSESEYLAFATVPAGGNGRIAVSTLSGSAESSASFEVTTPPELSGFSPTEMHVGGTLRITGANFGADPMVSLSGAQGYQVITKTPTEVHVKMTEPGKNIGVAIRTKGGEAKAGGTITVWSGQCRDPWIIQGFQELQERKPFGQGDEGECEPARYRDGKWVSYEDLKFAIRQQYGYKEKPAPTLTRIDPSSGVAGQWVTIYGTGFDEVQSVIFGNNVADQIDRKSSSELRAKIHFGSSGGDVSVSTLYGVGRLSEFGVVYPPSIGSVIPSEALPGADISIRGLSLGDVGNVSFGNTYVVVKSKTESEIIAVVPKGLSGYVKIAVSSPKGSSSWEPFGIVAAKLSLPTNKLRNLRLEFVSPNGTFLGSTPLIGNAGAGLTDAQIDALIGNAGAGLNNASPLTATTPLANVTPLSIQDIATLIGNAGAGLNNASPLLGNTAGGLSQAEIARLVGNSGVSLIGNTAGGLANVTPLIGNAGAGLVEASMSRWTGLSLSDLIGNAGAGLAGGSGGALTQIAPLKDLTTLTQVAPISIGETLPGGNALSANTGAALTGSTGGLLIGNTGATLIGTTGGALATRGILQLSKNRSVQRLEPSVASRPAVVPTLQERGTPSPAAPEVRPVEPPFVDPQKLSSPLPPKEAEKPKPPAVTVTPVKAKPDTKVNIKVVNFTPGKPLTIYLKGLGESVKLSGYADYTGRDGSFSKDVYVPSRLAAGKYTIEVSDTSSLTARTTVTIEVVVEPAPVPIIDRAPQPAAPEQRAPAPPAPAPTPAREPDPAPAPAPEPEPARPTCPIGSTYSPTFGRCLEDAPVQVDEPRPTCPEGQTYSITLRQCVR